jgi:hypothetical protein
VRAALEFGFGRRRAVAMLSIAGFAMCVLSFALGVGTVIVVLAPRSDCHPNSDKQQSCDNECEKLAHRSRHPELNEHCSQRGRPALIEARQRSARALDA